MGFIVFQYQKPNALNMNKGLLIQCNDQRKLEKLSVHLRWPQNEATSFNISRKAECQTAHVWAHWQKKKLAFIA